MAKSKNEEIEVPEANLLPVMNIMFLLIPGLLLAMEVASMAAVVVSPPKFAAATENQDQEKKPEDKPLDLKVMVKSDGYFISSSSQQEGADAGASQDSNMPTIPVAKTCTGPEDYECFDYKKLQAKAAEYKAAYPKEVVVKINAEPDISMQVLINTMDALRGDGCKLLESVQAGKEVPPECLFWNVIIEPTN